MHFRYAAVAASMLVTACASAPEPTREEWLAATQRTYDGVTADQVLAAAEQVFRLADPNDVAFEYGPGLLIARRDFWFYAVFAFTMTTEIWEVRAEDRAVGATHTSVRFYRDEYAFGTSGGSRGPDNPELYALLWDRIDYLLGRRDSWPECPADRHLFGVGLCGPYVDDLKPTEGAVKQ
jgi:hypothetical protein